MCHSVNRGLRLKVYKKRFSSCICTRIRIFTRNRCKKREACGRDNRCSGNEFLFFKIGDSVVSFYAVGRYVGAVYTRALIIHLNLFI